MEAQGGAGSPEPNKDIQKLLKPSSSGDLSKELLFHHPAGEEEEGGLLGHTASLLHITEKRQPLSSVSSLEVHFDLLDLTELTDMSDQELAEVFADSDEENHNESPAGQKHLTGSMTLQQTRAETQLATP
ncbi:dysbindin domain-containing protein 1 isoform X2 [Sebastes fasciatus]|uniref:dysbindin domain-containing protein 1 isoform X2 n=1 Tax=Sebastes fasciatus TaxID=394691 RepID=UPI003D9E3105